MSDIRLGTFHLGSCIASEDKLGQLVLEAGLGGGSIHFSIF